MSIGQSELDTIGLDRRTMIRGAGLGAAALAATAISSTPAAAAAEADLDIAILNFALNLEYLEAEFYIRAVTGEGLTHSDAGGPGYGNSVTGGRKVNFGSGTPLEQYAYEIASDEYNHVRFLRKALGDAKVGEPVINFTDAFNTLGQAAGIGPFDPFASPADFLLGSFVFEDVGVTAYHGAAPLITNKDYLLAAAGILAVEAYHASEIRLLIAQAGLADKANKISALRAYLARYPDDQGVTVDGKLNIVPTDFNSIAFARTPRAVLNIVYGGIRVPRGLFFPNGLNGPINN